MRHFPVEVLLSFPTPNYVDPVTRGPALVIVNVVFMALVTVFVTLRLYTRLVIKRWFGVDDWFIILAFIFTLGMNCTVILANQKYYWDRHVWDIPISGVAGTEKIVMAAKVLFTCASSFTRVSLILFYYRLIGEAERAFRRMLHFSMCYVVTIWFAFIILSICQCTPISAYWTWGASGHCIDEGITTLSAGVVNCTADLLVTVLPIPMVLRLNLPLRQRIGVLFLLSLGFIVTAAGIVRTYYIWRALISTYDESWLAYPLWISAAVEIDLGLLCACAPALRTLITEYCSVFGRGVVGDLSRPSQRSVGRFGRVYPDTIGSGREGDGEDAWENIGYGKDGLAIMHHSSGRRRASSMDSSSTIDPEEDRLPKEYAPSYGLSWTPGPGQTMRRPDTGKTLDTQVSTTTLPSRFDASSVYETARLVSSHSVDAKHAPGAFELSERVSDPRLQPSQVPATAKRKTEMGSDLSWFNIGTNG